MSSTIVYQGSQSCFEPQHTQNKPLRLTLAAPKLSGIKNTISTEENTSRNFLESLSNCSQTPKKTFNAEKFHPSLRLSQKSLELCTENLGSETGSDDIGDLDILSFTSFESRSVKSLTKKAKTRSFPPPLTTISGSNSIHIRPHREGGRLIIEAVEAPSSRACFQAERGNGRLQLRFLKNCEFFYDSKMRSENIGDVNIHESETEDHNTSNEEDVFEEDEFEKISTDNNIVDEIRQDVEVGMGRENFQRHNSSRCKERGFCNWEAFLVAT
ncbi:hypothetical protein AgCh_002746 [Apium graveolens]